MELEQVVGIGIPLESIGGALKVQDLLGKGSGILNQVLGSVAPLLDDGLLDATRVVLGVDANLLGHLDAVGLLDESVKSEKKET